MFYDYWSLENIKWDNGAGIEDLITFGIGPIKAITDIIDDGYPSDNKINHLNLLIRNMLENMERGIYRLIDIRRKEAAQGGQKESQPIESIEDAKKEKSTFEDHRFWEYVAQIKIDGADPADILETWLKEHNPEHFEDSDELKEGLIKKLAAIMGVDPAHVVHNREYSVEQQELMIAFVKFLHKGESKLIESIKELLTLVVGEGAKESPETAT